MEWHCEKKIFELMCYFTLYFAVANCCVDLCALMMLDLSTNILLKIDRYFFVVYNFDSISGKKNHTIHLFSISPTYMRFQLMDHWKIAICNELDCLVRVNRKKNIYMQSRVAFWDTFRHHHIFSHIVLFVFVYRVVVYFSLLFDLFTFSTDIKINQIVARTWMIDLFHSFTECICIYFYFSFAFFSWSSYFYILSTQ